LLRALNRVHLDLEERAELGGKCGICERQLERNASRAEAHDAHAFGLVQMVQQIHVVIDAHDRASLAPQLTEQAIDFELLGRVKMVRGLVEEQRFCFLRD
jgi:extradiol dioxygenase family protein